MPSYTVVREVRAPRELVFSVLTDHEGYTAITPLHWTLERPGEVDRDGVGAVRAIRANRRLPLAVREQVTEYQPADRFAYRVISGAPVRRHEGFVTLTDTAEGTRVEYRMEIELRVPLPTRMVTAGLRTLINTLLRGVVKQAESQARSTA